MKILVLTDRYPPYFDGGYEIQCEKTVNELKKRGHEILVLTTSYGLTGPQNTDGINRSLHCCATNFKRNRLSHPVLAGFIRDFQYYKNSRNFYSIFKSFQPDMVYAWHLEDVSIYPLFPIEGTIPIVFDIGDLSLLSLLNRKHRLITLPWRLLRSVFLKDLNKSSYRFNYVRFISAYLKEEFSLNKFCPENPIVLPRGVENDTIRPPLRGDTNEIKLLYAGRITQDKGIEVAIRVLKLLKHKKHKIRFDIVGEGADDYITIIQGLIHEYKLQDTVFLPGKLSYKATLELYTDYDIFFCPITRKEPFGNVFIEALAKGLPVLASNSGGIPEIIDDGVEGFLCDPNNPLLIADALDKLCTDPALRKKMSQNALKKARTKFLHCNIVDELELFLKKAISPDQPA